MYSEFNTIVYHDETSNTQQSLATKKNVCLRYLRYSN